MAKARGKFSDTMSGLDDMLILRDGNIWRLYTIIAGSVEFKQYEAFKLA